MEAQLSLFKKSGSLEQSEIRFILNNLDKSNNQIARILNRSEASIRNFLSKEQIRRSDEQLQQVRARIAANQTGEKNPNWKGGRSSQHYFYKLRSIEKYPEKNKARLKVYRAVKSGKLKKLPCEVCGDPKSEAHHHKGYENALDVQWLCRQHHIEADKKLRERYN